MVNWKKWFIEEDEDEVFEESNSSVKGEKGSKSGERQSLQREKISDKERLTKGDSLSKENAEDAGEFDIEFSSQNDKELEKKEISQDKEINIDDYEVTEDFDVEFIDETDETAKDEGFFGRIKSLFNSNKLKNFDETEEIALEEDDEKEDYKTYLERQKNQNKKNAVDEEEIEEKRSGFLELLKRLKDKMFEVSDKDIEKENIEKENLDTLLDELHEDNKESVTSNEEVVDVLENEKDNEEKSHEKDRYLRIENINLEDFEEKENTFEEKEVKDTANLDITLKKLGVENAEIRDVDIFSDKSERRTHPTLAAVRTKRLKQDHKIENLGTDVTLEKDTAGLKEEIANTYKEKTSKQDNYQEHESKHKLERKNLNEDFNARQRREDKIEKGIVSHHEIDSKLDEIFDDIREKETQAKLKEIPELEVRELDTEAQRREKLKYTSVDDILEGTDELFEDDIDKTSKKTVGERFEENIDATEEVENFRRDLYHDKEEINLEKTNLDELIESENINLLDRKEGTLSEIENLNTNLEVLKQQRDEEQEIEEENIDLVEKVAHIEDIEVEDYEQIKEAKKDILDGYSDYHLDEEEILALEEQNQIEETADHIDIDSLTKDIVPNSKNVRLNNDVDKFIEEKTVSQEISDKRKEISELSEEHESQKPELEEETEQQGIEYTEKLYTDDVYSYFDNDKGTTLGEYKTIDRGYRPVSREKIENNQKILEAIFEKYSTNGLSTPKKTVTSTIMETDTITPKSRNIGKFKPSPVYSSVYGSGPRGDNRSRRNLSTGKTVNNKKQNASSNANIYKEIASQEETVWNIGTAKRVPKNKVKSKKTNK
ncbi:hypothetical protein [Gemella cuniculi]|uniref:hypothetical protein n=1 Tax=Gemella cuniculi TaxID=150240 RepID=UPI0003FA29FE|nr:hypothetical protein [Gemella cuniculi]